MDMIVTSCRFKYGYIEPYIPIENGWTHTGNKDSRINTLDRIRLSFIEFGFAFIEFDYGSSNSIVVHRIRLWLIKFDCGSSNSIVVYRIRLSFIEFDCRSSNSIVVHRIRLSFTEFDCRWSKSIVLHRIRLWFMQPKISLLRASVVHWLRDMMNVERIAIFVNRCERGERYFSYYSRRWRCKSTDGEEESDISLGRIK
jgi:hypothetical protein